MNKLDYLSRLLSKVKNKRYEYYLTSRIWHLLNDNTIEIVSQQYVALDNEYALVDLYFPQFNIVVEIDEIYHLNQSEKDKIRDSDIINAIGAKVFRISTATIVHESPQLLPIEDIHNKVDEIINYIIDLKNEYVKAGKFQEWDLSKKTSSNYYIEKGSIALKDNCAFHTVVEAANCFGKKYAKKGIWKGGVAHSREPNKAIWFPKLYENKKWDNDISVDEKTIYEISKDLQKKESHFNDIMNNKEVTRIVFAHGKSPLGYTLYRFKGEFRLDEESSNLTDGLVWRRISGEVKTYS